MSCIQWHFDQSLLERIEAFDEGRVSDIVNDMDALADMAPECTGFMVGSNYLLWLIGLESRSRPTFRF